MSNAIEDLWYHQLRKTFICISKTLMFRQVQPSILQMSKRISQTLRVLKIQPFMSKTLNRFSLTTMCSSFAQTQALEVSSTYITQNTWTTIIFIKVSRDWRAYYFNFIKVIFLIFCPNLEDHNFSLINLLK